MTKRDQDEEFLRRWSRRKIEGGPNDEAQPDAGLPEDSEATVPDGSTDPEDFDPEVVADLPDIETLDKDSDYTGFLRDGVPEGLKKLALRKLWLSDPVLANLDGLNDYDEDFGAILKTGAEYMQRLAAAGEKFTRPGAAADEVEAVEEPEELVAEDEEPDADTGSQRDGADVAELLPPDTEDPAVG